MIQSEECIICGAPLEYLEQPEEMVCAVCHRKFTNNVRCTKGHYVCDECHTGGIDSIIGICMSQSSTDPVEILESMMSLPICHMHGPEHHIMVGAALITAYRNAGGEVERTCPAFNGRVGRRLHIGFDDPDAFTGSEDEILSGFRRVRDSIGRDMAAFIEDRADCGDHQPP